MKVDEITHQACMELAEEKALKKHSADSVRLGGAAINAVMAESSSFSEIYEALSVAILMWGTYAKGLCAAIDYDKK